MAPEDPKRVLPTVGFPALQFNTAKKQFVATREVSKAVIHQKADLTFNFQLPMKKRSFEYHQS
jgi:hypothetical protein